MQKSSAKHLHLIHRNLEGGQVQDSVPTVGRKTPWHLCMRQKEWEGLEGQNWLHQGKKAGSAAALGVGACSVCCVSGLASLKCLV